MKHRNLSRRVYDIGLEQIAAVSSALAGIDTRLKSGEVGGSAVRNGSGCTDEGQSAWEKLQQESVEKRAIFSIHIISVW